MDEVRALAAGSSRTFTLDDATHILTPNFIRPAIEFRFRRAINKIGEDFLTILCKLSRRLKNKL